MMPKRKQAEADDAVLEHIEQQQQTAREAAERDHLEYLAELEAEHSSNERNEILKGER
jgi:hypothetical protein